MTVMELAGTAPAYTTIAQAQRAQEFDYIQGSLLETLDDEEVQTALGGFALELLNQAENLFLPDERHGTLYLPHEYRDSNGFALTPADSADRMMLDTSMQQQTPSRRSANGVTFNDESVWPLQSLQDCRAWALTHVISASDVPAYSSRPVITFSRYLLNSARNAVVVSSVAAHEIQHGIDFEAFDIHPDADDDRAMAGLEFKGFYVGTAIARLIPPGSLADPLVRNYVDRHSAVERRRAQLANPGQPFEATDDMLAYARDAGILCQ